MVILASKPQLLVDNNKLVRDAAAFSLSNIEESKNLHLEGTEDALD